MAEGKQVFEFERSSDVLVVVPTGSLMEFRDNDIRNAYNDTYRYLNEPDVKHLLVDFSNLEYFASTFVGMLIRLAKKARQGGGEAVLCKLSNNMKQMMKTLMLLENTKTDFFWVPYESREAALAALAEQSGPADQLPSAKQSETSQTIADDDAAENKPSGGGWAKFGK